ncbi:MAG TPA: sugar transferase [Azospirillaceae bacterium]|nr:sugar transferase [Azospirillaceae bacterium]
MTVQHTRGGAALPADPIQAASFRDDADDPGYRRAKRAMDVVLSCLFLLLSLPVLLGAAALIWLTDPGPVLFRQVRIGLGERPFEMLKLRTMRPGGDDRLHRAMNERELRGDPGCAAGDGLYKLADDPRVTPVGRVLRTLSIDELPQLLNVLRGEMSLVGPRPSLPWEVALYTPAQRRRHACLPGITGLWQVSGRNRLSMPEMLALDLVYLGTRSLRLDVAILLRTPAAVICGKDSR